MDNSDTAPQSRPQSAKDVKIGYRATAVIANALSASGLIILGFSPLFSSTIPAIFVSTSLCALGSGIIEITTSPLVEALPGDGKSAAMSVGIMWPGTLALAGESRLGGETLMFAILALAGDVGATPAPPVSALTNVSTGILTGTIFPVASLILLMLYAKSIKAKIARRASKDKLKQSFCAPECGIFAFLKKEFFLAEKPEKTFDNKILFCYNCIALCEARV